MKRYGHLFERIVAWDNLYLAVKKAARGKSSRPAVARFLFHLEPELLTLQHELRNLIWRPRPYFSFQIRDPKPRLISAADFRDRVVHHALMNVLDPIFERAQFHHSYACRRGKGTHAALLYVQRQTRRFPQFLKGDVDHYFETVDHAVLSQLLRRMIKDPAVLELLGRIVSATPDGDIHGRGLPIGNLTSQYFANHLLGQLDQFVKRELRVRGYCRFMDDFILFGSAAAELHRQRAEIRRFLADALRLRLKESATCVGATRDGVPFLGFRVFPGVVRLQGARWRRMRGKIRRQEQAFRKGRLSADQLVRSVRSSIAHIEHAATRRLRRKIFEESFDLG